MCGLCEEGVYCARHASYDRVLLEEDEGFELKVAENARPSAVDFKSPVREAA